MLSRLILFSIHNRSLVVAAALALVAIGGYTAATMPVDVFPDLTAPTVTVLTEAHGMAPTEVETLITFPIETAVNGAAGVRRVRSSSTMGISVVWVEFDWGVDVKTARQTVNEKLAFVQQSLPEGADQPLMAPQTSIMGEVMIVALTSTRHSMFDVRTFADNTLRRRLLAVPGVAQVTPIGGEQKQYQVILSPQKLQAYRISSGEVAHALAETNENAAAGVLIEGGQELLIQGIGRIRQLDQIADTVVAVRNNTAITVSDLAEVRIGPALKRGDASAMGLPAVVLSITKQPHVNTLTLTQNLDATLDEVAAGGLPEGMTLHRNIFNQADFIETAVHNVQRALRDGGILVILIVLLFLGNLRASFITLTAIPLSLLTAVLTLSYWGASINTMTLGGMAIAIGELVDDAIVDVENVFRRLRQNAAAPPGERQDALKVVYEASVEIRSSIVFATLIVVLVFIPLFFLPGVEGRLLAPLGVAYIASMGASLLVAVTLTPALCYILLPTSRSIHTDREPPVARWTKNLYRPVLEGALKRPLPVMGSAAFALAAALAISPLMGRSFLPEFNEGALTITAATLPGVSLDESNRLAGEVERILLSYPEVSSVARITGRAELSEHTMGVESSEFTASLDFEKAAAAGQPRREMDDLLEALRGDFETIPGMIVEVGQPISHRIDHMLSGTRAAIAISIFAPDDDVRSFERLRALAEQVEHAIEDTPGVVDLAAEQQMHVPTLDVQFDRPSIRRHGLRISDVAAELERAFAGETVSQVLEGRNRFDLAVRISQPREFDIAEIRRLPLAAPDGSVLPLSAVADVRRDYGPNSIGRENVLRKIVVSCNVAGRDVGSVVDEIQQRIAAQTNVGQGEYAGYYVRYGGQFESAQSAFRLLAVMGCGVVLCIGLLLHVAFRSAGDALLVLLNLPMALIGGIVGVFLAGGVLSIASLVGFITLLGIATRNGIMLVSHVRRLQRDEGESDFRAAVFRGAMERVSPIMMTALSTGLGLLPLALAGGSPGSEIETPLAIVVLCGLMTSTALNMVVVPAALLQWGSQHPPVLDDQ